jgi:serine/threonine-protein kinase
MPDQWKQISALYDAALRLPEDERADYLKKHAPNENVRLEVESLLAHEQSGEQLLESPAMEVAAKMMAEQTPVLKIGQTIGHYEIISLLGKGGMGEVYQAKDTKLGRDVAIKVLPIEFAIDAGRVERFQREARLLAALNHPNIAGIHGLEESGGSNFLVMELVGGETLADRIKAGPIPVEEVLKLALQIAEGLEAAHEKGIIHRDLKPANIKVTPEGKIKILDFGLAKAFAPDQGEAKPNDSPIISAAATRQGVILGTAAYMSPEQVKGKTVDKRADIWAFGCVMFEMLTGQAAFQGEDVSEIFAAVIKGGADLTLLPENLNPRVHEALIRCLKKDLRRRYVGIADVCYEIEQALFDPDGIQMQSVERAPSHNKLKRAVTWVATIFAIVITGVIVWNMKPVMPQEPRQVMVFDHHLPQGRDFGNMISHVLAISPDGSRFVFSTGSGLFLRSLHSLEARLIPGTEDNPYSPFFSPDGQSIGYWSQADSKLKRISINGGTPVSLCDAKPIRGAIWYHDDTIVYADIYFGGGIKRVSANGGTPEILIEGSVIFPQVLPNGKSIIFTDISGRHSRIMIQSLKSGDREELFPGIAARYLPTGHLVYSMYPENNSLFAVAFDDETLEVSGEHVPVIQGIGEIYAVSDSGNLVYIPQTIGAPGSTVKPQRTLVWVDRSGKEELAADETDGYEHCKISPDATKAALTIDSGMSNSIWIRDLNRKSSLKLTSDEANDIAPLWSPDGKRIAYFSDRDNGFGIYWKAADNPGDIEKLFGSPNRFIFPCCWSDDGNYLVIQEITNNSPVGADIAALNMKIRGERKPLLQGKYHVYGPQISPDGKWMAYQSNETGQFEIYLRPFPDVGGEGQLPISSGGGHSPLWSLPDGRELFYRNGDATMSVRVKTGPAFNLGKPEMLFRGRYYIIETLNAFGIYVTPWDINPNDGRFLMIKPPETSQSAQANRVNIVLNWFEELKKKVLVK